MAEGTAGDVRIPFPDPRRFEAEIAAFDAEDRANPPGKGAFLCVGSSSIRMWHATIREDLAPAAVLPRGFGGSTMLDVLYHAHRIVIPCQPASILLYEGDNDIASGVSAQRVRLVFDALTETIHAALPETIVFVLSIKPTVARRDFWPEMREANRLLREACEADPRLAFIDVAARMLDAEGRPRPDLLVEDGLHLNAAGYAIWRKEVRRTLFGEGDGK